MFTFKYGFYLHCLKVLYENSYETWFSSHPVFSQQHCLYAKQCKWPWWWWYTHQRTLLRRHRQLESATLQHLHNMTFCFSAPRLQVWPWLLFDSLPDWWPQGCDTHLPLLQGLHLHIQAYMLTTDSCILQTCTCTHLNSHLLLLVETAPSHPIFAKCCVALLTRKCSFLEFTEDVLYISFSIIHTCINRHWKCTNLVEPQKIWQHNIHWDE